MATTPATAAAKLLVVVIGFYGSKPKHVDKYAEVWHSKVRRAGGEPFDVLAVPCTGSPLAIATWGVFDARAAARTILSTQCTEVVFHVLSNRGMMVYVNLVYWLLPRHLVKVRGAVFDSCPGDLHPKLFFYATAANQTALWKRRAFNALPTASVLAALPLAGWKLVLLHLALMELASLVSSYVYHALAGRFDPSRCPTLFLYSGTDALVSASSVERTMAMRRASIGHVFAKRWLDSAHVKHLVTHEQEYASLLQDFINRI